MKALATFLFALIILTLYPPSPTVAGGHGYLAKELDILDTQLEDDYMFGFRRKKVVNKVIEVLSYTVGGVEIKLGAIPKDFWEDPYILGFMSTYIDYYVTINAEPMGGLRGKQFQLAKVEVMENLSGSENYEVASRVADLYTSDNPDFKHGVENAEKVFAVMLELPDYNDDPDFIKAKEKWENTPDILKLKESFGDIPDHGAIAMEMQVIFLVDYSVNKWGQQ